MDGRRRPDLQPENENDPNHEEILDLTKIVEGEDDDDIIDLDDILEPTDQAADEPEETVIDLMDVATTLEADISEAERGISTLKPEEGADTVGPDTDFMLIEDVETTTPGEGQTPAVVDRVTEVAADTPDGIAPVSEDSIVDAPTPGAQPAAAELSPPTEEQMEVVLERVIEKIYGEKIKQMMIQTIKKTVKQEIEKIKKALLEDGDGMVG